VAKGYTVSSPEFSPDGIRIVFTIDGQIWVMNADGSAQRQVTHQAGFMNNNPSWALDGRKIALLTNLNQLVLSIRGDGTHRRATTRLHASVDDIRAVSMKDWGEKDAVALAIRQQNSSLQISIGGKSAGIFGLDSS
jgi:Tol biopolymer transport system component